MLKRLTLIGIVSGGIFGLLLKVIEQLTGKRVYTLLLNVDYFPLLKDWELNEVVEFSLHIAVSIVVVWILYVGLKKIEYEYRISLYIWANVLIGGLLYFTTTFSERTPELTDMVAFTYWIGGHIIFGALVGILIKIRR